MIVLRPSLHGKRFKVISSFFALSIASLANAEITEVDGTFLTVDDVVSTLLGSSLSVTDIQYSGDNGQIGLFSDYEYLFGESFKEGVILSTGHIESVGATVNTSDKTSTEFSTIAVNDEDLGSGVFDPAKLSFTFYPVFSTITLDFIFGSEEYNEYVHSNHNDRFEILVNGENCAKTPDGKKFSVNTVNDRATYPPLYGTAGESSNPELYINNDPRLDRDRGRLEAPSVAVHATAMDGFSKLIQCTATVNPNEANTLVIGIVDEGDAQKDSWVFLRAQSLHSIPPEDNNPSTDSDGDGIPNVIESPDGDDVDSDEDGVADRFDLDSDNDGIPDSIEYQGNKAVDQDMDGHVDSPSLATPNKQPVDTDNDGTPDYLDYDSDSDTLTDLLESLLESRPVFNLDANSDGILDDTTDIDNDGLFDVVDPVIPGGEPGQPLTLLDLDSDGLYNYRDVDSDGDLFEDNIENDDFDKDGINDRLQKEKGLKTAVSGVGSFGWEHLLLLPLLVGFRRLRAR